MDQGCWHHELGLCTFANRLSVLHSEAAFDRVLESLRCILRISKEPRMVLFLFIATARQAKQRTNLPCALVA